MRKEVIGNATLYLGDCLEILPKLDGLRDGCQNVDVYAEQGRGAGNDLKTRIVAVITDPPYGIGFKYESHVDDPEDYPRFLSAAIRSSRAVSSPGAIHCWFQAMKNVGRFHEWFPPGWRIYAAAKNFVQIRPVAMQYAFDPVVTWWEKGPMFKSGRGRDFYIANTAGVISNSSNPEKGHPAPRPLDQMEELIGNFASPDGFVLDPFMGSGTTGVACMNLGRHFIGIEIEPKYFDIACRRIEDAQRQQRLIA